MRMYIQLEISAIFSENKSLSKCHIPPFHPSSICLPSSVLQVEELRKEVEILSQQHEREIDRKDALLQLLDRDLNDAEGQYLLAFRCAFFLFFILFYFFLFSSHIVRLVEDERKNSVQNGCMLLSDANGRKSFFFVPSSFNQFLPITAATWNRSTPYWTCSTCACED